MKTITFDEIHAIVARQAAVTLAPIACVTPLGYACAAVIRGRRETGAPLTPAELERIAREHGVRISDLWPVLPDAPAAEDDDHETDAA